MVSNYRLLVQTVGVMLQFLLSYCSQRNGSRKESFDSNLSSEAPTELLRTRTLDAIHLKFNLEAGLLLPLALR